MLREILIFIFKKACKFFSGCTTESSRFFKIVYKLLICPLKSTTAEIKGHKIFLDSNDSLCLSILGEHDPYETLCIEKIVKKNDTVLDVGANIGYFTLILARLVGENGKVFAFEPDPDNMVLLQKNINENGYKNLEFIQKAVSDKTGKCKLYLNKENKGNHTIYAPHENSQFIEIESIRLDDYFKDYDKKINFVKIDVEGAEETVLEGMSNLIKRNKGMKIVIEFWPDGLKKFGATSEKCLKLLQDYGFEIYCINERKRKIESIPVSELLNLYTPEKKNYANLLCVNKMLHKNGIYFI